MLWNRAPNLTPRQHFSKQDPRNVNAANARLMELRRRERLVTPPEDLPSWQWLDPRRAAQRNVTRDLVADPEYTRSALGGWAPRGVLCERNYGQGTEARIQPSKPQPMIDRGVLWNGGSHISVAAVAVATLRGCRFPIGDAHSADFHFCNEARDGVGPYCARHAKMCFHSWRRRL